MVQIHCAIIAEGLPGILNVPSEYPTIQAAIDAAATGDTVLIAPGIYSGEGNHDISFRGKAITVRSVDPNDVSAVNSTIIDCGGNSSGFNFGSGEDVNSVLDGLTITNSYCAIGCGNSGGTIRKCNLVGNADCGIYAQGDWSSKSLNIINCRITDNGYASHGSGGVVIDYGMTVTIVGCDISRNVSKHYYEEGGGIYYGGWYDWSVDCPALTVVDCNISNNSARWRGGGIYINEGTSVVIDNCRILNNQADYGGGIVSDGGVAKVTNSVIAGNVAHREGGGVYGSIDISDSIVVANSSQGNGGGLYLYSIKVQGCTIVSNVAGGWGGGAYASGLSVFNSIFWGNSDSSGTGGSTQIYTADYEDYGVSLSCIQDVDPNDENILFGGEEQGNIDDNPRFVRMPDDGGDGWGVGDNDDYGDLHLRIDSPCIDAGSPLYKGLNATDIDGQPRVIGRAVDMGADEYGKMIVVTRPKAGEMWATGSKRKIEWTQNGVSDVNILLSTDNGGKLGDNCGGYHRRQQLPLAIAG